LLAHEATHALEASRPGAAWHRATTAGMLAEERRALSVERGVLTGGAAPPAAAPSAPAWTSPSSPAQAPAAAAVDRFEREDVPAAQPAPDLTQFRRDLHRELLLQIRTEFERGG
jgi:hypothetical protein